MPAVRKGASRWVFLVGRYAVKIPSLRGWRDFLWGLLANMQEAEFSRLGWDRLCPVVAAFPLGTAVVMRRADPVSEEEFAAIDFGAFVDVGDGVIPAEPKASSFGRLGGRLVCVDYG